jgi:hypothetical protein
LSFNTQNTKSFIHAEQYGKKKKRISTQIAKLLSTAKTSQITTIKPLNQKVTKGNIAFKKHKQPKLRRKG